jgi:tetratricopeptide (TPR) repeat protein
METDGQRGAVVTGHAHWDMARAVLTFTLPDEEVQLWYRATTAHMMQNGELAYVIPHSAAALKLFPTSANALFAAGCLHERLASSRIQRVVEPDRALTAGVGGQSTNTALAERFFRRARAVDPTYAEASVRLGRLLAERGERSTAGTYLRGALDPSVSRVVAYYRALFLGELEADLGNTIAAAAAYREAQELFPRAQSPRLALGLLAMSAGQQLDSRLLAPLHSGRRLPDEDPWWVYTWCEGRDAEELSTALRATLERGTR